MQSSSVVAAFVWVTLALVSRVPYSWPGPLPAGIMERQFANTTLLSRDWAWRPALGVLEWGPFEQRLADSGEPSLPQRTRLWSQTRGSTQPALCTCLVSGPRGRCCNVDVMARCFRISGPIQGGQVTRAEPSLRPFIPRSLSPPDRLQFYVFLIYF